MKTLPPRSLAWLLLGAGVLSGCLAQAGAAEPPGDAESLFRQGVLPLLQRKCFACHGDDPKKVKGELDLRSLAGIRKGGESGPVNHRRD